MEKSVIHESILILKNDAVGDLTHSILAINNIIESHKNSHITIYLSERSKNFSFLINNPHINFININYDLTISQKFKLLNLLIFKKISKVFILTPKNFYFILPFIFRHVKFFGLCINGPNNYMRPSNFLRSYLYKFVINDREAIFKRQSSINLQVNLTKKNSYTYNNLNLRYDFKKSNLLQKYLPKEYIYFHVKKSNFDKLGWSLIELDLLFNEFLKHFANVVFTMDIEKNISQSIIRNKFNVLDFSNNKFTKKNNNIFLYDNITGKDLYNTITNSAKTVAFHGMMTNLAAIEKKPVIDLWYSKMTNWDDYRNTRNAFYEFKPKYKGYDFIIPRKNIIKTIKKLKYILKK